MSRFRKIMDGMDAGIKTGLNNGMLLGAIVNGLPKKWVVNSSLLKTATGADEKGEKNIAHTFGFVIMLSAGVGMLVGIFKGMFGKAEEDKPEQKTAQEQPQVSQAVEHGESKQEEPLRSPDTTRTKAHAEGMEPSASRVGAEESRPKEGAVAQR